MVEGGRLKVASSLVTMLCVVNSDETLRVMAAKATQSVWQGIPTQSVGMSITFNFQPFTLQLVTASRNTAAILSMFTSSATIR